MENVRNIRVPSGPGPARLLQLLAVGGAVTYAGLQSIFNVEGGHR